MAKLWIWPVMERRFKRDTFLPLSACLNWCPAAWETAEPSESCRCRRRCCHGNTGWWGYPSLLGLQALPGQQWSRFCLFLMNSQDQILNKNDYYRYWVPFQSCCDWVSGPAGSEGGWEGCWSGCCVGGTNAPKKTTSEKPLKKREGKWTMWTSEVQMKLH